METFQHDFIEFALRHQALCFGEFKLKSGRISPYFFNAGLFNSGKLLAELGHFYAAAIAEADLDYDILFGPAYKGIPLVSTAAVAMARDYAQDIPFCFNRKETKDHGEGGQIVGSPLHGRVLLIDDVITAGTAVREAMGYINAAKAQLAGIIIALDRQERGQGKQSAIAEIEQAYQIQVFSIITMDHLVEYLQHTPNMHEYLAKFTEYREKYGVAA